MTEIKAKAILEVAGFPKEHVERTIKKVVAEVGKKENYVLSYKEFFPVEEKNNMFSGLAEIDVSFKEIVDLYEFCFNFMPASIDILEPEELIINARDFNSSLNDMLVTLHQQDQFLKNSNARTKVLNANLSTILVNFISYLTKEGSEIKEISKKTGIELEKLKNLLKNLVKQGALEKRDEKYFKK